MRKPDETPIRYTSFYFPEKIGDQLKKLCEASDCSKSRLMRNLITKEYDQLKKKEVPKKQNS